MFPAYIKKSHFTNLYWKYILRSTDEPEPVGDDEDSDEEDDDTDAADGHLTKVEIEDNDDSFLARVMESFVQKCSVLKTRSGRAGLVHNFLRGLQLMTAPVPSGEPRSFKYFIL